MKIIENTETVTTKMYYCEFCDRASAREELIRTHELECPENPNSEQFIETEFNKSKRVLSDLIYVDLKNNDTILRLCSIDNDKEIMDILNRKIDLTSKSIETDLKDQIYIPKTKYWILRDHVRREVKKRLKDLVIKQNTRYILIDNNDYFSINDAKMEVYKTKKDALLELFGSPDGYEDENGNNPFSGKRINWNKYFETRIKEFVNGDGDSIKHVFELDLITNIATIII